MISSFMPFLKANACNESGVLHVMVIIGYLVVVIKGLPSYGEDRASYSYTVGTLANTFGSNNIMVL